MSGDRQEGEPVDAFARDLRRALKGYGPEAPAEKMWREIEARRRKKAPTRWSRLGLAAAAVLVLALGLSRIGLRGPEPSGPPAARETAAENRTGALPGPFTVSSTEHLREAETLLMLFRWGSSGALEETRHRARSLLGTTRLLMDSPAATDPRLARALSDLELVLVQIVNLEGPTAEEDRRFLERSLEQGPLMSQLRRATDPTDPFPTAED